VPGWALDVAVRWRGAVFRGLVAAPRLGSGYGARVRAGAWLVAVLVVGTALQGSCGCVCRALPFGRDNVGCGWSLG